jgi:N utilization substance protein A
MNNPNIVEALTQISREKNVDRELVVQTLNDALVSAAKKRFPNVDNFEVELDADTGHMAVLARKTVVEEVNEPELEIDLEDARLIDDQAQMGAVVLEQLNLAEFGRNAIQTAKQILVQRVREAERERIYDQFSIRVGSIESGTVQQISHGDIVLNLGRAEAAIPLKEQIRRERYRQGDSIRGYIYEVLKSTRGPQVLLSRTHPELLRKLFSIEVPEISEGIVEIHAVAREPGERAKIAVSSNDERVDPVGACVGVKGSRVQAVVRELSGERIDIVPWIDEPEVFIARALSPASVSRVILDRRRKHAAVIVNGDQLSLAIGRSGQNSRLAVQLTGWGLDIITDEEHQVRRALVEESQEELRRLDGVSELIALSLATSGFISIKSIATADTESLKTVPGVEEELHGEEEPKLTAAALKGVAENYVAAAEARGEALRPATLTEIRAAADAAAAEAAAVEAAAVEAAAVEPAAAEPAAAEPATETEAPATDAAGGSGPDDESSAADEAELASLAPAGASGSGASGSGGEESGEEETQAQDDPIVTLKEGNEIE